MLCTKWTFRFLLSLFVNCCQKSQAFCSFRLDVSWKTLDQSLFLSLNYSCSLWFVVLKEYSNENKSFSFSCRHEVSFVTLQIQFKLKHLDRSPSQQKGKVSELTIDETETLCICDHHKNWRCWLFSCCNKYANGTPSFSFRLMFFSSVTHSRRLI